MCMISLMRIMCFSMNMPEHCCNIPKHLSLEKALHYLSIRRYEWCGTCSNIELIRIPFCSIHSLVIMEFHTFHTFQGKGLVVQGLWSGNRQFPSGCIHVRHPGLPMKLQSWYTHKTGNKHLFHTNMLSIHITSLQYASSIHHHSHFPLMCLPSPLMHPHSGCSPCLESTLLSPLCWSSPSRGSPSTPCCSRYVSQQYRYTYM